MQFYNITNENFIHSLPTFYDYKNSQFIEFRMFSMTNYGSNYALIRLFDLEITFQFTLITQTIGKVNDVNDMLGPLST